MITAEISNRITLRKSDFDSELLNELRSALTIPNGAKEQAIRQLFNSAYDLPDFIYIFEEDEENLYIPRGFKNNLLGGIDYLTLEENFCKIKCDFSDLNAITLRDHQTPAVISLIANEQGIYSAPAGSGKTVTILEAIRRSSQRAIILTNKGELASQWRRRAQEFLGTEIGFIGDGMFDERDITVSLMQTLYSRANDLSEQGFFDRWGFVAYDECHSCTADTYQLVVQKFSPKFLIGVSATPDRVDWNFPIATALLGPVFHTTTRFDLVEKGILVKPVVDVRFTDFEFAYRPARINSGGYRVGNNYSTLIKDLVNNTERNRLIISDLMDNQSHHNLVISKRLNHLKLIKRLLKEAGYPHDILDLTGKESLEERTEVCLYANENPCTVLSTIADEGLDIPRLDRLFLIFPGRNISSYIQRIGRIERFHPEKKDAVVYDYCDQKCGILKSQFKQRRKEIYRPGNLLREN